LTVCVDVRVGLGRIPDTIAVGVGEWFAGIPEAVGIGVGVELGRIPLTVFVVSVDGSWSSQRPLVFASV
jgi:hypothetical protein